MLHSSVTISIEEIESAMFSDDTFACPKENYLLAGKLISWLDRLQSLRGLPANSESLKPADHTFQGNAYDPYSKLDTNYSNDCIRAPDDGKLQFPDGYVGDEHTGDF